MMLTWVLDPGDVAHDRKANDVLAVNDAVAIGAATRTSRATPADCQVCDL